MNYKAITHIPYRIFKARGSGLKKTPRDDRDFRTGIFGWFRYTPKRQRYVINTKSVKRQSYNCCQWNATTVQKEHDENELLSVRSLVAKGVKMGLVSGDGFSNLRGGQKVLQAWGIVAEKFLNEKSRNWREYSNVHIGAYDNRAGEHKIASYWSINSRADRLKLLDDNRILTTGLDWYTGFNMGGGFKNPWLITKKAGLKVGGHAFVIIGYDLNYQGKEVYVCQNSYGPNWGDKGKFYIDMDYLDKHNYGFYTNLDEIDVELSKFIIKYDGQNVKGKGDPGIFHIQKGKKKPYPNWESFLAWNGKRKGFIEVDKNILDRVDMGDIMDIKKTDYWKFLRDVKEADRLNAILELLNKEK